MNKKLERRNYILPNKIIIQLKDNNRSQLRVANILCHLNIYINKSSYFTYSFIPTNSEGKVVLTSDEIVENTELKHYHDSALPATNNGTEFEFFVISCKLLKSVITSIDSYLSVGFSSSLIELRSHGLSEEQIKKAEPIILKRREEDEKLNNFLKKNKNCSFNFDEEKSRIKNSWHETKDYYYDLIVQQ